MQVRTHKIAKRVGRRAKELRRAKKLSQEVLAEGAGLERAYYWKLENGRINATLVKIADALDVDIMRLFEKPGAKS
jgi:transcriptional regulator with XRE-family HTH domain